MARLGSFDEALSPKGQFDAVLRPEGWLDPELLDEPGGAPPEVDATARDWPIYRIRMRAWG